MASRLVSTFSSLRETPNLVDSHTEADRSELESVCRNVIFSFIKMKESDPTLLITNFPTDKHLLRPKKSKRTTEAKRGTKLGATPSTDSDMDHSEGSSVDLLTDSSVDLAVIAADDIHVREDDKTVEGLVPSTLPLEIRDKVYKVEEEDLRKLYDIEAGVEKVKNNELSTVELVVLHLRSYRNIINYEISDMETFRSRFVNFFGSIFADLMEACYPACSRGSMAETLARDFQEFRQRTNNEQNHEGTPSNTLTPNGSTQN